MPDSEKVYNSQDQLIALIALALDESPAQGPTPSLEEINLWRSNGLPVARAKEVLSHLARDTACMRQLRQLDELDEIELSVPSVAQIKARAEHQAAKKGSSTTVLDRFSQWLGIGTGRTLAGGVCFALLALLALLVLPSLILPPAHMGGVLQQDISRWASEAPSAFAPLPLQGKSSLSSSPELSQLRQGALAAVRKQGWQGQGVWLQWAAGLEPQALVDCGSDAVCEEKTDFYQILGGWFLAVFNDCERGAASLDDFLATAKKFEDEAFLTTSDIGVALHGLAQQDSVQLCRMSADILGL